MRKSILFLLIALAPLAGGCSTTQGLKQDAAQAGNFLAGKTKAGLETTKNWWGGIGKEEQQTELADPEAMAQAEPIEEPAVEVQPVVAPKVEEKPVQVAKPAVKKAAPKPVKIAPKVEEKPQPAPLPSIQSLPSFGG